MEGAEAAQKATTGGVDPGALRDALGGLQGAMQLANGLGALNLAVNTAGFAMIGANWTAYRTSLPSSVRAFAPSSRTPRSSAAWR